jgi:hypothetical protein
MKNVSKQMRKMEVAESQSLCRNHFFRNLFGP